MKKNVLMVVVFVILYLGWLNETWAMEGINCKIGQQSCGTNCCWSIEDNTLKITGGADGKIGTMNDYDDNENKSPWLEYKSLITNIEIGRIKNIGDKAFKSLEVSGVSMDNNLQVIGNSAFGWNGLTSLEIPDSVEEIRGGAFAGNKISNIDLGSNLKILGGDVFWGNDLKSVIIPDSLNTIGLSVFGRKEPSHTKLNIPEIICRGNETTCENLKNLLANYEYFEGYYEDNIYKVRTLETNLYNQVFIAAETDCESNNYYWSGSSCNNKKNGIQCDENFKQVETWCNRIRYTPAEAAAVLNDNNNSVTITFKK